MERAKGARTPFILGNKKRELQKEEEPLFRPLHSPVAQGLDPPLVTDYKFFWQPPPAPQYQIMKDGVI